MKIADPRPPFCAACFQPLTDGKQAVDFEAAYDGPVIPGSPENQPVDDLVICEDCLKPAATLLGLGGLSEAEHAHHEAVRKTLEDEIAEKDKAINDLRHTINTLAESGITLGRGAPALRGIDPKLKEQLLKQRKAKRKRSTAQKAKA